MDTVDFISIPQYECIREVVANSINVTDSQEVHEIDLANTGRCFARASLVGLVITLDRSSFQRYH